MNPASIRAISSAVPARSATQADSLAYLAPLAEGDRRLIAFLKKIHAGSGIEKRHTVIDARRSAAEIAALSTADRNDIYTVESNRLALEAARRLLDAASFSTRRVSHLVTVSCTGFAVPGFGMHVIRALGLAPTTEQHHLGFMGCSAAFPALKLARHICRSEPGAGVLIIAVELCSLHLNAKADPDALVAHTLFADGAAAAFISARAAEENGPALILDGFHARLLEEGGREMVWTIGERGFDLKLSASIPEVIEANFAPIMNELMGGRTVDLWAVHPGGKKILDRLEASLGLDPAALAESRAVLSEYGNMSSATILFVLERILKGPGRGTIMAAAFGPGLTIETGCLEKTN